MADFRFNLSAIFIATFAMAGFCIAAIYLGPPDLRREAERISSSVPAIAQNRIFGQYVCGTRGSVYRLSLTMDGRYSLDDEGCVGSNGSATGSWTRNGNLIELSPLAGTGHAYTDVTWLLATLENGCVTLVPDDGMELYLKHGYSPYWSLTKNGDHEKIRLAQNVDER